MYDIRAYMVGNMISEIVLGFCTDIFFKKNMNVTAAVPIFASCKIRIEVESPSSFSAAAQVSA